jgi:hypothetical protein
MADQEAGVSHSLSPLGDDGSPTDDERAVALGSGPSDQGNPR